MEIRPGMWSCCCESVFKHLLRFCAVRDCWNFLSFYLEHISWSQKGVYGVYGDTLEVQLGCILSDGGFGSGTIRQPHVGDLDGTTSTLRHWIYKEMSI